MFSFRSCPLRGVAIAGGMAGPIRDLDDLARHGADLSLTCLDCGHARSIPIARAQAIFMRRGWSTAWPRVAGHFYCRECDSRRIRPSADFYGASLKRQNFRQSLRVIEGGRTCPNGVDPRAWAAADERERKRLIREARNR